MVNDGQGWMIGCCRKVQVALNQARGWQLVTAETDRSERMETFTPRTCGIHTACSACDECEICPKEHTRSTAVQGSKNSSAYLEWKPMCLCFDRRPPSVTPTYSGDESRGPACGIVGVCEVPRSPGRKVRDLVRSVGCTAGVCSWEVGVLC